MRSILKECGAAFERSELGSVKSVKVGRGVATPDI